jgi:hypothetical protein
MAPATVIFVAVLLDRLKTRRAPLAPVPPP